MHVQQHIIRSGRKTLSLKKYDNIRSAYGEMRFRTMVAQQEIVGSYMKTDYDTYISIMKNGATMRKFTLVVSKTKNEPIPWGHLIERNGIVPPTLEDADSALGNRQQTSNVL